MSPILRSRTPEDESWGRNRLFAILGAAIAGALLLLVGLGYAIYLTVSAATDTEPNNRAAPRLDKEEMTSEVARGETYRDRIAAAPMASVDAEAMKPTTPTTVTAGVITVPVPTRTGPADVMTGFPHTPEGAVAQLGEIGRTVFGAMSLPATSEVYDAWAVDPSRTKAGKWQLAKNVAAFLGAAGMGSTKSLTATVTATPAAGLIKGTDGPDWTLACVLWQVTATVTTTSSIGYGYCERMQWSPDPDLAVGGRWQIAPGVPSAPAPSTWPGSAPAVDAGWLNWSSSASAGEAALP